MPIEPLETYPKKAPLPWAGHEMNLKGQLFINGKRAILTDYTYTKRDMYGKGIEQVKYKRYLINGKPFTRDLLTAIAFKKTHLPKDKWYMLEVLSPSDVDYKLNESKEKAHHPRDLVWKHKVPIAVDNLPGYFYIPGYTRYGITDLGRIKEIASGEDIKCHDGGDGVGVGKIYYNLAPDNKDINKLDSVNIIRLLGLTFSQYPYKVRELMAVPNKNNKLNESISWVWPYIRTDSDYLKNLKRGSDEAIKVDINKLYMLNVFSKEKKSEVTLFEICTMLNISPNDVYKAIRTIGGTIDGWLIDSCEITEIPKSLYRIATKNYIDRNSYQSPEVPRFETPDMYDDK